jgi:hypothetical protein
VFSQAAARKPIERVIKAKAALWHCFASAELSGFIGFFNYCLIKQMMR